MSATVVLVHGAFHAGWCWDPVVSGLRRRAVSTVVIDLPGRGRNPGVPGGLVDSAAYVRKVVSEIEDPLVICGHSLGGVVISEAVPEAARVRELVYIAAIVPEVGQSLLSGAPELVTAPLSSCLEERDGFAHFDAARAQEIFYGDCSGEAVRWASARLQPEPMDMFTAETTQAAYASHPSCYVVCERDRAVPAEIQERLAKRCDRTLRWDCDHSPMLSRPELLVDLLTDLCSG